ncbi:uncharacterized protein DEA37_0013736 [Paragonimus westermani]|uniref:F-box domain-containing protein n=1 Tax=Paragonimus westermani TaxID=34504 RepID=A0A5J4NG78_9TREM|nr:uncharacterized protein DEA37_0013736 [Paragonimus westermani]
MATKSIVDVMRDMRRASTFRRTSVFNADFLITRLPDKLMLRTLSYLPQTDLCNIARVCKQWRRLAYDPSLWQSLNLRPEYGGIAVRSMDDLLNLIHHRSGAGLKRIELCSDLITVPVLEELGTFEQATEEEEEIYEVINISKIKAHTPNLRVINLYGINFIDDSHVELLATNCIHLECVALNFCLNVKGSSFALLIANCTKVKTLLLEHCGLKNEFMIAAPWEKSKICELDITSTELSAECLESFIPRIPYFTYLAVGHSDFFNDKILNHLCETGKFYQLRAIDLSYTPSLSEVSVMNFIKAHGNRLEGLMLQGKPALAEYFWTTIIPSLRSIKICVLGTSHGWFFKYNTRVHIDKILEGFSARCPNLEALEIQWDPATIRFSDKSRKFIDRIRLKCPRLKSLTLSDGKYYEMVKGNFERAECPRVVRTNTTYNTSIVSLLERFKDLRFN